MILIITAFPGTQTKKLCKTIALRFGLRHFGKEDAEKIMKEKGWEELKQRIQEEEKKGKFVTDSMIAGKQVQKSVKVFLNSAKRSRAKSIAELEKIPVASALELIEEEQQSLEKSAKTIFGTEAFVPEELDLMLNIDRLDENSTINLIEKFLEKIQK
ncbi:MAG: hypothetical protein Q7R70_00950 [Candidatus Diapherotrites archaeon]|nr:hypothetical protein [Candidatus Diapherotrites archaeon]